MLTVSSSAMSGVGRERFAAAPMVVIWEVTRACDLACVHCRASALAEREAGRTVISRKNGSERGQHLGFAGHVAGTGGKLPRRRAAQHGRTTDQHHAFIAVGDAATQPLQPCARCEWKALRGQPQGKMFQIGHALRTMMQRRAGSSPPAAACAGSPANHSGKAGSCAATSAKPCRA